MDNTHKTKAQLLEEVAQLRRRVTELEEEVKVCRIEQSHFDALLEHTSDYILISDADGSPRVFNAAYAQVIKELTGIVMKPGVKPHTQSQDANFTAMWNEFHQRVLSGERFRVDYSHELANNEIRYFEFAFHPIMTNGKVEGFFELSRDITECKRMEQALRENEHKLRESQRLAHVGNWWWDVQTGEVKWSDEVYRIFRLDPQEFNPQIDSIQALSPWPGDRERDQELIQKAIESHEIGYYEQRFLRPDGSIGYYASTFQGIYDDADKLVAMKGTVQDITERKQAEIALEESNDFLQAIYQYSNIAIFVVDVSPDNTFSYVDCNPTHERIWGITSQELAGKSPTYLVPYFGQKVIDDVYALYSECVAKKQPIETEIPTFIDGKEEWWLGQITPLLDDQDRVYRLIGNVINITERKQTEKQLAQERNFLNIVLENIPLDVYTKDTESRFVFANAATMRTLEVTTPEDYIGKTDFDFMPQKPEEAVERFAEEQQIIQTNEPLLHAEQTGLDREGNQCWSLTSKLPMRDEHGNITGILGIGLDITERKRTEKELAQERNFLNIVLENIPLDVYTKDIESRFVFANPATMRTLGITTPQEYIGKTDFDFMPQIAEERFAEEQQIIQTNEPLLHAEQTGLDREGNQCWSLTSKLPMRDDQGNITGILGIGLDITERKRTEAALEKRILALTMPLGDIGSIVFEDLFNLEDIQRLQDEFAIATGVASIITQTNGIPITRPSNFCRLCSGIIRQTKEGYINCLKSDAELGRYDPEGPRIQPCLSGGLWDAGASITVGGKHIANWLIGQVRDETQTEAQIREYAQQIGTDEEAAVETFYEVPTMSRQRFGEITQVLFTLANQLSTTAYQNVQQARFITERKQIEQQRLTLALEKERNETFRELMDNIAHDIKTPLSIINTSLYLLEKVTDPEKRQEKLDNIKGQVHVLGGFVQDLLAIARLDSEPDLQLSPVDVNELMMGIERDYRGIIEQKQLQFTLDLGETLHTIQADQTDLRRAFTNLVENATYYTPPGHVVTVQTRQREQELMVEITDTGIGIDEAELPYIFDRFYRSPEAKSLVRSGSGLGLAIVKRVVEMHRGRVEVQSMTGKGTTIRVLLPTQEFSL